MASVASPGSRKNPSSALKQQHHGTQNLSDDDGRDHGISDRGADHAGFFGR